MAFNLTYLDRFKIEKKSVGLTEPSGLALAHDGDGFWTVSDDTERLLRLSATGKVDKDRSFPVPDKGLESVTAHPGGKSLFVVREESNEILKVDIAKQAVTVRRRLADMDGYDAVADHFADSAENKGLEGITWNSGTRSLFCLKEGEPGLLIEVSSNLKTIRRHRVLEARNGFTDPGTDDHAVDYSGLCHDPTRGAFWIVSDRAKRLFLYSPAEDRVVHSAPLGYGRNGAFKEMKKAEGIAFDPALSRLYIVSDVEARLYVYDVRA